MVPSATAKRHNSPLAAAVNTNSNGLNGLRVYYGSNTGYIQVSSVSWIVSNFVTDEKQPLTPAHVRKEMGINFAGPVLKTWQFQFHFASDPDSTGIAAAAAGTVSHVYLRDQTSSNLWQGTYNFSSGVNQWNFGELIAELLAC